MRVESPVSSSTNNNHELESESPEIVRPDTPAPEDWDKFETSGHTNSFAAGIPSAPNGARTFVDFLATLPADLLANFETAYWQTIFSADTEAMQAAKQMLASKGERWNDAEMRMQLVRAKWQSLLLYAVQQVPEAEQEHARSNLAQGTALFFEQNGAFVDDQNGWNFLWNRAEIFKNLFAEDGALKLAAPEGYQKQIAAALYSIGTFDLLGDIKAIIGEEAFNNPTRSRPSDSSSDGD